MPLEQLNNTSNDKHTIHNNDSIQAKNIEPYPLNSILPEYLLCDQGKRVDLDILLLRKPRPDVHDATNQHHEQQIQPIPPNFIAKASVTQTLSQNTSDQKQQNQWLQLGMEAIRQGKCAVLGLAGGQGTRLGSTLPKGCFNLGLPSAKSLFQVQAERLHRLAILAGSHAGCIPWLLMTSPATHDATVDFFTQNNYFGLPKESVWFFQQSQLPCIDAQSGQAMWMDSSCQQPVMSPNGNGGVYQALLDNGLLDRLSQQGITFMQVYSIDNILVRMADPVFFGYAIANDLEAAAKCVRKRHASESVGVFCQRFKNQGKIHSDNEHEASDYSFGVVEYSELSAQLSRQVQVQKQSSSANTGQENSIERLTEQFCLANIVNHCFSIAFLQRVCRPSNGSSNNADGCTASSDSSQLDSLPIHAAFKKIPFYDAVKGEMIEKPSKPNGYKLEMFIFDIFPLAKASSFGILEVNRSEEFAPLKNGMDSPDDNAQIARQALSAQHKRYLQAVGCKVIHRREGEGNDGCSDGCLVEVSSMVSYSGEGLQHMAGKGVYCGEHISA